MEVVATGNIKQRKSTQVSTLCGLYFLVYFNIYTLYRKVRYEKIPRQLPTANFTSTTVDFTDTIAIIGTPGAIGSATEVYMDAIRLSDTASAFYEVTGTTPPPRGMVMSIR